MSYKVKQIALILILAASLVGSAALYAESIIPALHATMRTMRASLAQIADFAKGDGEPAAALDAATKVVTLAKSIPSIFPPGSELTELPSKNGAPPTTWNDVDRFHLANDVLDRVPELGARGAYAKQALRQALQAMTVVIGSGTVADAMTVVIARR